LNVSFLGIDRQALLMALDLAGIFCASGSACASGSSEPSPVLRAMGLPAERISSAIRLSVGATTRSDEIALAAERILRAAKQLRA
jgi:cysteine desulfurase